MIVTMRHLRSIPGYSSRPGFCVSGTRGLAAQYGLDFRDFARNGIDAARLEATGDPFALALVKWARACDAASATPATETEHG